MDRDLVCSSRRDSSLRRDRYHRTCRHPNLVQRLRVMDHVTLTAIGILAMPVSICIVSYIAMRNEDRRYREMKERADRKRADR